jgi:uncharacterized protein (DUF362 family)
LVSKVAIVDLNQGCESAFERALRLIGGIDDLNTVKRAVVIKVGVFNHRGGQHSTVDVVGALANSFNKARRILVVESDNYKGSGLERLQIWKSIFNERVVPFNLSDDSETRQVKLADEKIGLSHVLFKPNVFVSTHVLRRSDRGTILKNLLGLIPDRKKVRFHKKLEATLLDACQAVGGLDLAVLDATYTYPDLTSGEGVETNALLVSRDAVALEAVGAALVGLDPKKIPVIREATRRGLGVSDLEEIEVVGESFESLKQRIVTLSKSHVKSLNRQAGPRTWGGQVHVAFNGLLQEHFFDSPNRRTTEDVAKALGAHGIPVEGNIKKIAGFLARRVKNGTLKAAKGADEWIYWAD